MLKKGLFRARLSVSCTPVGVFEFSWLTIRFFGKKKVWVFIEREKGYKIRSFPTVKKPTPKKFLIF